MDILKSYFPQAFKATELSSFIISLISYALVDVVCGFVVGLLADLPSVGIVFSLAGVLVGLYATAGVVLSILVFVKVLK